MSIREKNLKFVFGDLISKLFDRTLCMCKSITLMIGQFKETYYLQRIGNEYAPRHDREFAETKSG